MFMKYVDSMSMLLNHESLISNVDGSYVNEVMNDINGVYYIMESSRNTLWGY